MTNEQVKSQLMSTINADGADVKQLAVTWENGQVETLVPTTTPPIVVPPVLQMTRVPQQKTDWYKQVENGDGGVNNVVLSDGGGMHVRTNGTIKCKNFFSTGVPSGEAMYFFIVATDPCKLAVLDNTDCQSDLGDGWIVSGNEAGIRLMGGFDHVQLINVRGCCRIHDTKDKGAGAFDPKAWRDTLLLQPPQRTKQGLIQVATIGSKLPSGFNAEYWKQWLQARDGRLLEYIGGLIVGPWDVGAQAKPLTPQVMRNVILTGVGLTHAEPHLTMKETYGRVTVKDCYLIDVSGKPLLSGGKLQRVPDNSWDGTAEH